MATCPHCNKDSISSLKANTSNPGKLLTCPECHKKSKVPFWPKGLGITIFLGYLLLKTQVDAGMALGILIIAFLFFIIFTANNLTLEK